MGWVKVRQKVCDAADDIDVVMSTDHIVSFNQLSKEFLKEGNNQVYTDCICVVKTDQIGDADGSMIVCSSVDVFTHWVRLAEEDGYFDATRRIGAK